MNAQIKKVIRAHRHWMQVQSASTLQMSEEGLQDCMNRSLQRVLPSVTTGLGGIATFHGIRGVVRLHDREDGGLEDVAKSLSYWGWAAKVISETFFRTTGPRGRLANDTTNLACVACVSEEWSDYAATTLQRISQCPESMHEGYWEERRLEPFVLDVCDLRRGSAASRVTLTNEPYSPLIRAWNDPDALNTALVNACEYHCQNMIDRGQDWNPEFKWSPFDLLPCEVILVRAVRNSLGLPMPDVSHPLISCLGIQNRIPRYQGDETLDRLAALMDKFGLS